MQAQPMSLCVCLSVCVSVTFVHSIKTNNISKIFHHRVAILVIPYQTAWQYSDRNPPNGGAECRWGMQKLRFWAIWLNCLLLALQQLRCCQHGLLSTRSPVDHGHLRAASYDASLVVGGDVDCGRRQRNVYDKKPQRYAKDNRTAHLTARSDKSVAYVSNNKDSTRRFVLLKLTTDRHEASRGLFATAELLVITRIVTINDSNCESCYYMYCLISHSKLVTHLTSVTPWSTSLFKRLALR